MRTSKNVLHCVAKLNPSQLQIYTGTDSHLQLRLQIVMVVKKLLIIKQPMFTRLSLSAVW